MKNLLKIFCISLMVMTLFTACGKDEKEKDTTTDGSKNSKEVVKEKQKSSDDNIICKTTTEDSNFTMYQKMVIPIVNKSLSNVTLYLSVEYDDSVELTDTLLDSLKEQMENAYSTYSDVEVTKTTRGVDVKINMTMQEVFELSGTEEVTKEDLKNLSENQIDEIMKEIENSGYECTR